MRSTLTYERDFFQITLFEQFTSDEFYFKNIQIFAKNIPDFILINLWRTEKLSESMKMRGYGIYFPMSCYPYISLKIFDLKLFSATFIFLSGLHYAL